MRRFSIPQPNKTTVSSQDTSELHEHFHQHLRYVDDAVVLFVIITSVVAVTSGIFVMYAFWRSKRQHRRLAKVVEMDSNDFLLYARVAQTELSPTPCKTSLPCRMPPVEGSEVPLYPIIVPGYVRIVQLTHPGKEQNQPKKKYRSVVVEKVKNKDEEMYRPPDANLPKSTSSAPAILSGLWQQRHLLTGCKDTLVDSFTKLKKPIRQQRIRASLSDTSPVMDRPSGQSFESICQECGSGSSSLGGGRFPKNISCRLCRERAGIRDVGMMAMMKRNSDDSTSDSD